MIQIIRQVCQKAGCQPKDLMVEWTPGNGVRLIGANSQGEKICLNILCRLEHLAHAVYLCANGQEHLYPRIQQEQASIDASFKEWLAAKDKKARKTIEDHPQRPANASATESLEKDWRQFKTVPEIMRAFPIHPSADDVIDLYQTNKKFNSTHLKTLLEKHSRSISK